MFGIWVGANPTRLVDVVNGTPGFQEFRIARRVRSRSGYGGTHQLFWDLFYEAAAAGISAWAPSGMESALLPVNNDPAWLIRERNAVNYDSWVAYDSALMLQNSFNPKRLRSLKGPLAQQRETTEGLLKLAFRFGAEFNLNSSAFVGLGSGSKGNLMKALVRKTAPNLVNQSIVEELLAGV